MDEKEANDMLVDLCQAPDEAIAMILKRVPAKDLVTACTWVSKQWHRILSQKFFWKEKLEEMDGYRLPWRRLVAGQPVNFYQMMAVKQPFQRNFIRDSWDLTRRDRNCCQPDRRWQTISQETVWQENMDLDGIYEVRIEVPPAFSQEPEMGPELGGEPVLACLATGYSIFRKLISIRLADEGLTDELMDSFRPTIVVSELIANRFGSPSKYQMNCFLRPDDYVGILREDGMEAFRIKRFEQGEAESWHVMRHEFKQYTAGMRYLIVICSGSAEHWDENYRFNGVKMARCTAMALCEGKTLEGDEEEDEEAIQSQG